jgi:hypothetical protein
VSEGRACSNLGIVFQLMGDHDAALKLHQVNKFIKMVKPTGVHFSWNFSAELLRIIIFTNCYAEFFRFGVNFRGKNSAAKIPRQKFRGKEVLKNRL